MSTTVGHEILRQLGGHGRLTAMIGAKDFCVYTEEPVLKFRFMKGTDGANFVKITLTPLDLYTVEFYAVRNKKGVPEFREVKRIDGVYCDMLKSLFERTTGLRLSL